MNVHHDSNNNTTTTNVDCVLEHGSSWPESCISSPNRIPNWRELPAFENPVESNNEMKAPLDPLDPIDRRRLWPAAISHHPRGQDRLQTRHLLSTLILIPTNFRLEGFCCWQFLGTHLNMEHFHKNTSLEHFWRVGNRELISHHRKPQIYTRISPP